MTLKLKRILISILCVLLCVCGAVALSFNATNSTFNASADIVQTAIPTVNDFYKLNDKAVFPNALDNVKVDPSNAQSPVVSATNGVIYYPNGTTYAIEDNKEFVLNLVGNYKLRYFGEYQNKDIVAEKSFSVISDLYGLSLDNDSFIDFATDDYFSEYAEAYNVGKEGKALLTPHSNTSHNLDDPKLTQSGLDALSVNLTKGTEFFYSKPIDLRNADPITGLTEVISFEPRAEDWNITNDADNDGVIDKTSTGSEKFTWYVNKVVARKLVIKLTDCYDSSRYIKMVVDSPKAVEGDPLDKITKKYPSVRACTDTLLKEWGLDSPTRTTTYLNGRPEYTEHGNKTLIYDGKKIQAWTASSEMKWFYGGEFGNYTYNDVSYSHINIKYDYEKSQLYCSATNKNGDESAPVMFTDFYNQQLYPASVGSFREFTTGEVFLSIGFDSYTLENDPARVDVYSIGDTKASELFGQTDFNPESGTSQHKFNDTVKPEINVDFTPTVNNGVFVATGDKFTIPSAKAIDVYLSGGVTVKAYTNYGTNNQFEVPIVNGKLLVERPDIYHIVYTAKDYSGNIGEKVIKVFGFNAESTIPIVHNTNQFANLVAGQEYSFEVPSSIITHNIKDSLKLKIEFVSGYETVVVADCKSYAEVAEFLNSTPKYKLSSVGEYTIKYYLEDNAYNNYHDPITYKFNVGPSDVYAIYDQPFMYRYYIKGAKYDFDNIAAYGFEQNAPGIVGNAKLFIKYDGGEYVEQNSVYGITITGNEKIQVKYKYQNAEVESAEYPIVNVDFNTSTKKVSMYKYFVGEGFTFSETKPDGNNVNNGLYYKATANNSKLQFILPVDISKLQFTYLIEEQFGNLGGVRFTLTDIYDENNKISVYQFKEGDNVYAQYNNETAIMLTDGASFVSATDRVFSYTASSHAVSLTDLSGYIYTTEKFTTGLAYLEIELCDITGEAGIILKGLMQKNNNMILSKTHTDGNSTRPEFIGIAPSGTYKKGETVTISPAMFVDNTSIVIRQNLQLTVKFGNSFVTSVDNVLLNGSQDPTRSYDIDLSQIGKYVVTYSATDSFTRKQTAIFNINVLDDVAPQITFNSSLKENVVAYAKPGYVVELDFTLSDNVTPVESLSYSIFILNKHTGNISTTTDKTFTLNYEGTYEISVVCHDADYNKTTKTFTVVLSNEGGK